MTSDFYFAVTLGTSVVRLRSCWRVSSLEISPLRPRRLQLTSTGYPAW